MFVLVAVGVFIYLSVNSGGSGTESGSGDGTAPQIPASADASDSHYLDEVDSGAVTVVEFLDFECSACGLFYPCFEGMREYYDGQINYVVRYFPLPNHPHSMEAVLAADFELGKALGVNSTPSFYVNDELIDTQRVENLPEAIDAALQ